MLLIRAVDVSCFVTGNRYSYSHFLRNLIVEESHASARAFHDDAGRQSAEDAGLIVFGGGQGGKDGIIRVDQMGVACRTCSNATVGRGQAASVCAQLAEDMAAAG